MWQSTEKAFNIFLTSSNIKNQTSKTINDRLEDVYIKESVMVEISEQ